MPLRKKILFHILILLVGAAYGLAAMRWFHCPIRTLTGVPCPFCGFTRALFSALRLKFAAAFRYHPLFWLAPFMVMVAFHRGLLSKYLSKKLLDVFLALSGAAFFVVWIIRLSGGTIL